MEKSYSKIYVQFENNSWKFFSPQSFPLDMKMDDINVEWRKRESSQILNNWNGNKTLLDWEFKGCDNIDD
ncbi:MAG: hypothetical protein ACTSQE_05355 [Candidatus Heimdallarchaeaceae archaeon]